MVQSLFQKLFSNEGCDAVLNLAVEFSIWNVYFCHSTLMCKCIPHISPTFDKIFPHTWQNVYENLLVSALLLSLILWKPPVVELVGLDGRLLDGWGVMVDSSLFDGWWLVGLMAASLMVEGWCLMAASLPSWLIIFFSAIGCWAKIQGTQWFHVDFTGELLPSLHRQ